MAPMALPMAADDKHQFTMHAVVDTPCLFVVYTKHPIWMENSNVMDLLLDEDKYIVVWFDLASHRVLCSCVPARALLSRPSAHALRAVGAVPRSRSGLHMHAVAPRASPHAVTCSTTESRAAKTAIRTCRFSRMSDPHLYPQTLTIVSSRFRSCPTTQ